MEGAESPDKGDGVSDCSSAGRSCLLAQYMGDDASHTIYYLPSPFSSLALCLTIYSMYVCIPVYTYTHVGFFMTDARGRIAKMLPFDQYPTKIRYMYVEIR